MEKQKRGRKLLFIEDDAVTLSIKVPSKQKEQFRQVVLAMRKQYEIKK
jgi:hypothetical protein